MDYTYIPDINNFSGHDEYVKHILGLPAKKNRPGTLRQFRALAASVGIENVMQMQREELIELLHCKIGWEKLSEHIQDIGVMQQTFLEMGMTKTEFYDAVKAGDIRIVGE